MPAVSRYLEFDADASTTYSTSTDQTVSGTGTIGYVESSSVLTSGSISITAGVADRMQVRIDGIGSFEEIQLTSGSNLDPRVVARDITYQIRRASRPEMDAAYCEFVNGKFRIYSSTMGTTSTAEVNLGASANCLHLLNMASSPSGPVSVVTSNGAATGNNGSYTGQFSVGGVYKGQFDDIYTVMIGNSHPVGAATVTGTYAGSVTTGGDWNQSLSGVSAPAVEKYILTVSTTNGSTMDAGVGNVPIISGSSDRGDSVDATELLYSNYWYNIGTRGLRAKFSDAPFGNGDTIAISCTRIEYSHGTSTSGSVGSAQYVWSSRREGKSASATTTATGAGTALGGKGLTAAWSASGQLARRDTFRVICAGPQPSSPAGVTLLNFGSVTVSTYSPTKVVWFELLSGAITLSNTAFGLQSHGTASHHNAGNNDTKFAMGISGEATPGTGGTQWKTGVDASVDLTADGQNSDFGNRQDNMPVVATAGLSESVGVAPGEMVSDFIYLAIKLGASEVGANSTINWRMFYDFSN